MSEYQYYEWQAVDRRLTEQEMEEVNRLSSHMDVVTPTQAIVTYSWGDFKHDERQVLLKYFDAMLYEANWGSRRLIFRFPKDAVDVDALERYYTDEAIDISVEGNYAVVDLMLSEEIDYDWIEGEGSLSRLIPIRSQIMEGDYRALYLGWLQVRAFWGEDAPDDEPPPPVPAGLKEIDTSLKQFVDFFQIDPYLVQAAAEKSPSLSGTDPEVYRKAVEQLSPQECQSFLLRLLAGEAQVAVALKKRLSELAGEGPAAPASPAYTAAELAQRADALEEEEKLRKKLAAEKKRIKDLNDLARQEEQTWMRVEALIEEKKARSYDEAVILLVRLRELAEYQGREAAFQERLNFLVGRYKNRSALVGRVQTARLV